MPWNGRGGRGTEVNLHHTGTPASNKHRQIQHVPALIWLAVECKVAVSPTATATACSCTAIYLEADWQKDMQWLASVVQPYAGSVQIITAPQRLVNSVDAEVE